MSIKETKEKDRTPAPTKALEQKKKPPKGKFKRYYGKQVIIVSESHIAIKEDDSVRSKNYKHWLSDADMTDQEELTKGVLLYKENDVREFKSKRKLKTLLKKVFRHHKAKEEAAVSHASDGARITRGANKRMCTEKNQVAEKKKFPDLAQVSGEEKKPQSGSDTVSENSEEDEPSIAQFEKEHWSADDEKDAPNEVADKNEKE